ncbi:MAG: hypothetical protein ACFWTZ_08875 [Burkholderia sp.]
MMPSHAVSDELGLDAELGGERTREIDVHADELILFVVERIGREGAFGRDLDHAGGLDVVELARLNGGGACGEKRERRERRGKLGSEMLHFCFPLLKCAALSESEAPKKGRRR